MTITTKFNINDEVWFIHPKTQRVVQGKVCGIDCMVNSRKKYEANPNNKGLIPTGEYETMWSKNRYDIYDKVAKDRYSVYEQSVFPTKQELINSL